MLGRRVPLESATAARRGIKRIKKADNVELSAPLYYVLYRFNGFPLFGGKFGFSFLGEDYVVLDDLEFAFVR